MKMSCMLAFINLQKLPDADVLSFARVMSPYLNGEDKTLSGMAVMALEATSGLGDVNYGPEQWATWLARREFEVRIIDKVRRAFEQIKKDQEEKPDAERTVKAVNAIGDVIQQLRNKAQELDQPAMDAFIAEMVNYNREIKRTAQ
jgi:hypothetical protein